MQNINYAFLLSCPVWDAWIEIWPYIIIGLMGVSRAPYGARGLKFTKNENEFVRIKVVPRMGRVD